jgi:hypothetical protein
MSMKLSKAILIIFLLWSSITCGKECKILFSPQSVNPKQSLNPSLFSNVQTLHQRYLKKISSNKTVRDYLITNHFEFEDLKVPEAENFIIEVKKQLQRRKQQIENEYVVPDSIYISSDISKKEILKLFDKGLKKSKGLLKKSSLTYKSVTDFAFQSAMLLSYLPSRDYKEYVKHSKQMPPNGLSFAIYDSRQSPEANLRELHFLIQRDFYHPASILKMSGYRFKHPSGTFLPQKIPFFVNGEFNIYDQAQLKNTSVVLVSLVRRPIFFDAEYGLPIDVMIHDFAHLNLNTAESMSGVISGRRKELPKQRRKYFQQVESYANFIDQSMQNLSQNQFKGLTALIFYLTHERSLYFHPKEVLFHTQPSNRSVIQSVFKDTGSEMYEQFRVLLGHEPARLDLLNEATETLYGLTQRYITENQ